MGITGFNRWRRLRAQKEKEKAEAEAQKASEMPEKQETETKEALADISDLIAAAKEALEAGETTKDGRPTVEAIEKRLGRNITAAERDTAWEILKKEHEEKAEEAKPEDESAQ